MKQTNIERTVGEKIETIILDKKSGTFGKYIGASAEIFGACQVEGVTYKVVRYNDAESPYYWKITRVDTGEYIELKDRYDLCSFRGFNSNNIELREHKPFTFLESDPTLPLMAPGHF